MKGGPEEAIENIPELWGFSPTRSEGTSLVKMYHSCNWRTDFPFLQRRIPFSNAFQAQRYPNRHARVQQKPSRGMTCLTNSSLIGFLNHSTLISMSMLAPFRNISVTATNSMKIGIATECKQLVHRTNKEKSRQLLTCPSPLINSKHEDELNNAERFFASPSLLLYWTGINAAEFLVVDLNKQRLCQKSMGPFCV